MSSKRVLDAYALIAFLEDGPGANKVGQILKEARDKEKPLYLSVVSWGQADYLLRRHLDKAQAERALATIKTLPIELIPVDEEITSIASEIRIQTDIDFIDCLVAALARIKKAQLITGDRSFERISPKLDVLWLDKST